MNGVWVPCSILLLYHLEHVVSKAVAAGTLGGMGQVHRLLPVLVWR